MFHFFFIVLILLAFLIQAEIGIRESIEENQYWHDNDSTLHQEL